jgi:hypothetical protein
MNWQEHQKKVKLFFYLFLRQHSPVPAWAGFFKVLSEPERGFTAVDI